MSWNKDLEGTYIRFKTKKHLDEIIKFYTNNGFTETKGLRDCKSGAIFTTMSNTGVRPGQIFLMKGEQIYNISPSRRRIRIPSKPRRAFPREMMVSNDGTYWYARIVLAKCTKLCHPFIAASPPYKPEDEFQIRMINWKYAKEID